MSSIEVTESVRKQWKRYSQKHGRLMKDFTSETLRAVMQGKYIRVPKKEKGVKFEIMEEK